MLNKRPAFQTRAYSDWRIDIDYWDKLNEAETAYLINFLDEYYHSGDNGAQRDVLTMTLDQSNEVMTPSQRAYYTPEDYGGVLALSTHTRQGSRHWDDESE